MQSLELATLFLSSFLAATIFPAQSEALLASLYISAPDAKWILLFVASLGNILGSVVNWILGYYLNHFKDKKWFFIKGKSIEKASKIYSKYGKWSLLLAWLPFIGDPLTLIAGIFKVNIWLFLLLVSIGKVGRYFVIIAML